MTLILKEAMQVTKICDTMDDIFDACSSYLRLLENTYICKHNTSNNEEISCQISVTSLSIFKDFCTLLIIYLIL